MLIIRTPGSTSNLAVGFDALGLALDLNNVFGFEEAEKYSVEGFTDISFESNLVYQAYVAFCRAFKTDPKPVKISLLINNIPIARGLGSSASCIVAGVLAANEIHELKQSKETCAAFAASLEGHPDNAFACVFGGLVAIVKEDNEYLHLSLPIASNLRFALLIPETIGKTEELRSELPSQVSLEDAVFHLSRSLLLPEVFAKGDFKNLQIILQDKLHETYRSSHIPQFKSIQKTANENHFIALVSGSGPSVFLISNHDDYSAFNAYQETFQLLKVKPASGSALEVQT